MAGRLSVDLRVRTSRGWRLGLRVTVPGSALLLAAGLALWHGAASGTIPPSAALVGGGRRRPSPGHRGAAGRRPCAM